MPFFSRIARIARIGPTSWIAVLAAGIVIPILSITVLYVRDIERLAAAASDERAGIAHLTALGRTKHDAMQFLVARACGPRPVTTAAIERDVEALTQLEQRHPIAADAWARALDGWHAKAGAAARAAALVDGVKPLFVTVADESGVTYDPEVAGINLADALAYRLPRAISELQQIELTLCAHQSGGLGSVLLPVARLSGGTRAVLGDAEQDFGDAYARDPDLRTVLEPSEVRASIAANRAFARLDRLEARPDPRLALAAADAERDSAAALHVLCTRVAPALDRIVRRRITSLRHRYYLTVVQGFLTMATAALFVFFGARSVLERAELSRIKRTAAELRYHATHDALTRLPNRAAFVTALESATAALGATNGCASVLFIDLDNFKLVNDSLGHAAGDTVLCTVADRLATISHQAGGVMMARFGGDEFAMLVTDRSPITLGGRIDRVVERIAEELAAPVALEPGEQQIVVSASVGIASLDSGDLGRVLPAEMLRNADVAMYEAKSRGRACAAIFGPAMHERVVRKLRLTNDLRGATARHEFVLEREPIVRLSDGAKVASEALIRWQHPTLGRLLPGAFLAVAEESGAIIDIGRWVLDAALGAVGEPDAAFIHINLAVQDLAQETLLSTVATLLTRYGVPPNLVAVEITEGSLLRSGGRAEATVKRLRRLGVRIWIDDFGVEYSSLRYLDRLPVDGVKIDRSFIGGADGNLASPAIVKTILELARSFDLEVIAEGIETTDQREALLQLGCQYGQGYLFTPGTTAARSSRERLTI